MSYCVNCGVELDRPLEFCPLCNTPVINPREIDIPAYEPTFPKEKGEVDVVKRTRLSIFLTVFLTSIGASCGVLNIFVYRGMMWSLLIIGLCGLIWVLLIPAIIYRKMSSYAAIFCDGLAAGIYLCIIARFTSNDAWLHNLGLPILALVTALIELMFLLMRLFKFSFIMTFIYILAESAILSVGIELLIKRFNDSALRITWSALVLSVCVVCIASLATLLTRTSFRESIRRKLHF